MILAPTTRSRYEWLVRRDGLGVFSSTAAEFTYTPTRDGTYEISLLVSDDDSGEAAAIKTLNVRNDVPSILVDSLVLKANGLAVDFVDEGDAGHAVWLAAGHRIERSSHDHGRLW